MMIVTGGSSNSRVPTVQCWGVVSEYMPAQARCSLGANYPPANAALRFMRCSCAHGGEVTTAQPRAAEAPRLYHSSRRKRPAAARVTLEDAPSKSCSTFLIAFVSKNSTTLSFTH
jgi:hypothetical protein